MTMTDPSDIGEAAGAIGVGIEELREYRFAAALCGLATERLDGALLQFTRRKAEAEAGAGTLSESLGGHDPALLDSITAAEGSGAALDVVFKAIAKTPRATERVLLATIAFGSAGVVLVSLVQGGFEGLGAMRAEFRDRRSARAILWLKSLKTPARKV